MKRVFHLWLYRKLNIEIVFYQLKTIGGSESVIATGNCYTLKIYVQNNLKPFCINFNLFEPSMYLRHPKLNSLDKFILNMKLFV